MTRTELRRVIARGELTLVRRGWYRTETADASVASSVASGGVCTCVSALRLHGVWIPEGHHRVHTRARAHAHKPNVAGPSRMCRRYGAPLREDASVDDVPTALAHAVRCLTGEDLIVVLDSIMNLRLMTREEIERLLRSAPTKLAADGGPDRAVRGGHRVVGSVPIAEQASQSAQSGQHSRSRQGGSARRQPVDHRGGRRGVPPLVGAVPQGPRTRHGSATARLPDTAAHLPPRGPRLDAPEAAIMAVVRRGDHLTSPAPRELTTDPGIDLPPDDLDAEYDPEAAPDVA